VPSPCWKERQWNPALLQPGRTACEAETGVVSVLELHCLVLNSWHSEAIIKTVCWCVAWWHNSSLYSGIRWRSFILTLQTKGTFYKGLHTARIAIRLEPITYIPFNCILIFHMYFKPCIIVQIYYFISVHWVKHFCNISMYLSFVKHLPKDGHMSGRNM
jgi:hypothetical protein